MEEKLTRLYNTLKLIYTKGDDTKTMAECLKYLEVMIGDEQKKRNE